MEVNGTLQNTEEGLKLNANFQILLSDYEIGVPSNLVTKISQNIEVKVKALLSSK